MTPLKMCFEKVLNKIHKKYNHRDIIKHNVVMIDHNRVTKLSMIQKNIKNINNLILLKGKNII